MRRACFRVALGRPARHGNKRGASGPHHCWFTCHAEPGWTYKSTEAILPRVVDHVGLGTEHAMLYVNERIQIPETEFDWSFVRSSGPGGQNVNKVASKAVLRWHLANSPSVP